MSDPVNQHYIPAFFWRRFLGRKRNTSRVYTIASNSFEKSKTNIRKATAVENLYNIHSYCLDHSNQSPVLNNPYKAEDILGIIERDISNLQEGSWEYFVALRSLLTFKNPDYLINTSLKYVGEDAELLGTNLSDFFFDFFNTESQEIMEAFTLFGSMNIEGLSGDSGGLVISDSPIFAVLVYPLGRFVFLPIRRDKILVAFENNNVADYVKNIFYNVYPFQVIMWLNEFSYDNSIEAVYGDKKSIEVLAKQIQNNFTM